jgi:predicted peroxiredoxin
MYTKKEIEQSQLNHISKLIDSANKLGIKTYVAPSQVELWSNKKYDEFFNL